MPVRVVVVVVMVVVDVSEAVIPHGVTREGFGRLSPPNNFRPLHSLLAEANGQFSGTDIRTIVQTCLGRPVSQAFGKGVRIRGSCPVSSWHSRSH